MDIVIYQSAEETNKCVCVCVCVCIVLQAYG